MSNRHSVNNTLSEPLLRSESYGREPRTSAMPGWEKQIVKVGYKVDSYLMEFIGTMFLVVIVGLASSVVAIGYGLCALVFLGGHISGSHYNPAVTMGEYLSGRVRISIGKALFYILAQSVGAFFGALLVWAMSGKVWAGPAPQEDFTDGQAFLAEFVWTSLLVLVVMNCATVKIREGNSYFGLAIGFTVAAGAFCVGPISGGGFNPAVAGAGIVLSALAKGTTLKYIWIYVLAPFLGSIMGAFIFRLTNPKEFDLESLEIAM